VTGGEIVATLACLLLVPAAVWVMVTPHDPGWLRDIIHRDQAMLMMAGWTEHGRTGDVAATDRWRVAVNAERFLSPEFTFIGISTGSTVLVQISDRERAAKRNVVGKVKARMYAKAREAGVLVKVRVIERPYGADVEGVLLRS
jgi:hypothetical protein